MEPNNDSHLLGDYPKPLDKTQDLANVRRQKCAIQRSIWGVNMAFFFAWTSISGLSIIQSSIIGEVGTIGMSLNFAFSIIGCTILAPVAIRLLGCKLSMLIGFCSVILWESSNFYPTWWTVLPGAMISGGAMGPMFAGQGTYLTKQGIRFASLSGETEEGVIGRFFGLFFCVFLSSVSVGCLVTSAVLSADFSGQSPDTVPGNDSFHPAGVEVELAPMPQCGAGFCPTTYELDTSIGWNTTDNASMPVTETDEYTPVNLYVLVAVHVGFTIVGAFVMATTVDRLPKESSEGTFSVWTVAKESVLVTLRQCKRGRQLCMGILNIYVGMMQSFALADITNGFIACAIGVENTGYTLVTYGFVACAASAITGLLVDKTGRIPLYTFANGLRVAVTMTLLFWVPDPRQIAIFYILPALWSVSDAMLIALTNSFYGVMFSENTEGAFSAYRFFESLGFVIGYVYNSMICVDMKIYILLAFHLVGSGLYYLTEWLHSQIQKEKQTKEVNGNEYRTSSV